MQRYLFLLLLGFSTLPVFAQNNRVFHFGDIKPMQYTDEKGYGFDDTSGLLANHGFISAPHPFYFSVKLPPGNYDVTVILGDTQGRSATTVRAESRRLFLENIRTQPGEITERRFTVNIRDSGNIKLKPRERAYRHWDNRLTIEFNDSLPKVRSIRIVPNVRATTVFLAGNSTVTDQDKDPWASWGQIIPAFFEPGKVAVANYAESGEALHSFKNRLQQLLSVMRTGDYLFIEFGHNDQKRTGEGIGAFTSYKKDLEYYITQARAKGGIPVLITSMHRRSFDSTGRIVNTLGDYPAAVRLVAAEQKVALIDLNAMSKTLYEAWGPVTSLKAFVHYPANSFPGQPEALKDNTHFSTYGAYEIARCVAKGMVDAGLPLALKVAKFDPARPDAVEGFYWPGSVMGEVVRPDGN